MSLTLDEIFITPAQLAAHCKKSERMIRRDIASRLLKQSVKKGIRGGRISLDHANRYIALKFPGKVSLMTPEMVEFMGDNKPKWCRSLHHEWTHAIRGDGTSLCGASIPLGGRWIPCAPGDEGRTCTRCQGALNKLLGL